MPGIEELFDSSSAFRRSNLQPSKTADTPASPCGAQPPAGDADVPSKTKKSNKSSDASGLSVATHLTSVKTSKAKATMEDQYEGLHQAQGGKVKSKGVRSAEEATAAQQQRIKTNKTNSDPAAQPRKGKRLPISAPTPSAANQEAPLTPEQGNMRKEKGASSKAQAALAEDTNVGTGQEEGLYHPKDGSGKRKKGLAEGKAGKKQKRIGTDKVLQDRALADATAGEQGEPRQNGVTKGPKAARDHSEAPQAGASVAAESPDAAAGQQAQPAVNIRNSQLPFTVFVGNLPADVRKKHIVRLFKRCGTVKSVRLRSLPIKLDKARPRALACKAGLVDSSRGTAHAYVVFLEEDAVEAALQMNMTEFRDHHLRIDRARAPSKARGEGQGSEGATPVGYDPARTVFVGNLHFETQDEELIQLFNAAEDLGDLRGQVEAVRCVRDAATNIGKGIAFVLFKDKAAARAALALKGVELRGRELRVVRCKHTSSTSTKHTPQRGTAREHAGRDKGASPNRSGKGKLGSGAQGDAPGLPRAQGSRLPVKRDAFVSSKAATWQGLTTSGKGKAKASNQKGNAKKGKKVKAGAAKIRGPAPDKLARTQRGAVSKKVQRHARGIKSARKLQALNRPDASKMNKKRKAAGKRPSVAARKQKQKAAKQAA